MPLAFTTDQLAKARASITDSGESIAEWSRRNNFDLQITGHVLRGSLKATRGEAHRVAIALGLRKRVAKKRISRATPSSPTSQPTV
jgi:gp16 family phage-associated protein